MSEKITNWNEIEGAGYYEGWEACRLTSLRLTSLRGKACNPYRHVCILTFGKTGEQRCWTVNDCGEKTSVNPPCRDVIVRPRSHPVRFLFDFDSWPLDVSKVREISDRDHVYTVVHVEKKGIWVFAPYTKPSSECWNSGDLNYFFVYWETLANYWEIYLYRTDQQKGVGWNCWWAPACIQEHS